MNLALRIINVLMALIFVGGAIKVYGAAEGSAVDRIAVGVGASLWLFVPVFAFWALGKNAARGVRTTALVLNIIALVGLALFAVVTGLRKGTWSLALALVIMAAPFAFNAWRVWKLRKQAAGGDENDDDLDSVFIKPRETGTEGNYFVRHWRGNLSLPVSYWINGAALSWLLMGVFVAASAVVRDSSLRNLAIVSTSAIVLMLIATVWSSVGIWRSAADYKWRGESAGWATAAQVMTVLGFIGVAGVMPQLKEFFLIATGNDPIGRIEAKLADNASALVLRGTFGEGSTEIVRRALAEAPGVRTLMLESRGGRLGEARDIAMLARERKLNTYVESFCASACTYVFLAGVDRAATPNARIGFHRPSFAGREGSIEEEMGRSMLEVYREAGIPEDFVQRVVATSSESMWFPTRQELIDADVINRVSMGGEVATASTLSYRTRAELEAAFRRVPVIVKLEKRFPGTIERALEAAWQKLSSGAADGEVTSAARMIIAENFPKLLGIASMEQLEAYTDLMVDQMTAARKVSREACGLLMQSRLDISKVLPEELATRERRWIVDVLDAPPHTPAPLGKAAAQAAIVRAFQYAPPDAVRVITDFENHASQPEVQCEAMLEFYTGVMNMPQETRQKALRGLFQTESLT